jgi:hypothetical protein
MAKSRKFFCSRLITFSVNTSTFPKKRVSFK